MFMSNSSAYCLVGRRSPSLLHTFHPDYLGGMQSRLASHLHGRCFAFTCELGTGRTCCETNWRPCIQGMLCLEWWRHFWDFRGGSAREPLGTGVKGGSEKLCGGLTQERRNYNKCMILKKIIVSHRQRNNKEQECARLVTWRSFTLSVSYENMQSCLSWSLSTVSIVEPPMYPSCSSRISSKFATSPEIHIVKQAKR